jgi:hypothetical protein
VVNGWFFNINYSTRASFRVISSSLFTNLVIRHWTASLNNDKLNISINFRGFFEIMCRAVQLETHLGTERSINVFYVTVWCLEVISFVFHGVKCSSADGAVVLKKPCVSCCNTLPHWVKKTHFPSTQLPDCFRLVVQAESYLLSDHHSLDLDLLVHKDLPRYFELSMFKSAICGIALTHQWLSILTVWCQVRRWGYVT